MVAGIGDIGHTSNITTMIVIQASRQPKTVAVVVATIHGVSGVDHTSENGPAPSCCQLGGCCQSLVERGRVHDRLIYHVVGGGGPAISSPHGREDAVGGLEGPLSTQWIPTVTRIHAAQLGRINIVTEEQTIETNRIKVPAELFGTWLSEPFLHFTGGECFLQGGKIIGIRGLLHIIGSLVGKSIPQYNAQRVLSTDVFTFGRRFQQANSVVQVLITITQDNAQPSIANKEKVTGDGSKTGVRRRKGTDSNSYFLEHDQNCSGSTLSSFHLHVLSLRVSSVGKGGERSGRRGGGVVLLNNAPLSGFGIAAHIHSLQHGVIVGQLSEEFAGVLQGAAVFGRAQKGKDIGHRVLGKAVDRSGLIIVVVVVLVTPHFV